MYGDGRRALRWQVSRFKEDSAACTVVFMKGDFKEKASEIETAVSNLSSTLTSAISARYFYTPAVTPGSLEIVCNAMFGENDFPPTTPVPCRTIGSLQRDDWDLALCIISV
ncbi:hypothetical protein B0H34DRAFT_229504 [Crassisporium funariophilum]|nr:hypothetical protein B0H34DRAFT_229504 [Crassisporium funariophilum]